MMSNDILVLLIFVQLFIHGTPREIKLSPHAFWSENGVTVAGQTDGTPGLSLSHLNHPYDISISDSDVLYISDRGNRRIIVVYLDLSKSSFAIGSGQGAGSNQLSTPNGISITDTELYVIDNDNHRVQKLALNDSSSTLVTHLTALDTSIYLFVDSNGDIYLTDELKHQVTLFQSDSTVSAIVAGSGGQGSNNNQFNRPHGIFVTLSAILYIADRYNHRIMKWMIGASSGTRVAGDGTPGSSASQLNHPTYVLLDTNEYMYISEVENSRITRWAPHSTYGICIAACTGISGTAATQLVKPHSLAFDSNGSLYVSDWASSRVQKFEMSQYTFSYNRPEICTNAIWNSNGITFADQSLISWNPRGLFISANDNIYVADHINNRILFWSNGATDPINSLSVHLYEYTSLFVTKNGDVYFENGNASGRIDKWTMGSNSSVLVVNFSDHCDGLFIDTHDYVYCSIRYKHKIMKLPLDLSVTTPIKVAGTGSPGLEAFELKEPWGIFVDTTTNLYVADSGNHRIQFFRRGELNGLTVASNTRQNNLSLSLPTDVVLDAGGDLYVADNANHRIIRVGSGELKCIAGCTGTSGSLANEFNKAYALRFDSWGNLYVADEANHRIQRVHFSANSCLQNFTSDSVCDMLTPCQNNGICQNTNTTASGYNCSCPPGTNGTQCEELINEWSMDTSSQMSSIVINQNCSPPVIELMPSASSLSTRLTLRRHQKFHLSSRAQTNCSESSLISMKWKICNYFTGLDVNHSIDTGENDLVLPSKTLVDGLYQLQLIVTMNGSSFSSSLVYIEIVRSTIQINLIEFDTSILVHDYREDLVLNPGEYSIDPDTMTFNAADWEYVYYYRMMSTDHQEFLLLNDANNSSLVIPSGSLKLNATYQWLVAVISKENASLRLLGYLIVDIRDLQSPIIIINCIISTMCASTDDYHDVNTHTQLALSSVCIGRCESLVHIQWTICSNSSNETLPMTSFWFYGVNTKNLTIEKPFFEENYSTLFWHIRVTYSSNSEHHEGIFRMRLNHGPTDGRCSIDPPNGTLLTLFTINCSDWFDEDEIKDYSLDGWTNDPSDRLTLAYSTLSITRLRLPANITHLVVSISDTLGARTEYDLSGVLIEIELSLVTSFLQSGDDPISEILKSTDEYTVGQMTLSLSQIFNDIKTTGRNNLSITPLDQQTLETEQNTFTLHELNKYGNAREYLIMLINNMSVTTFHDLIFQSSILSELTQATDQLSTMTSIVASSKCHRLSLQLKSIATKVFYENIQHITNRLLQCTTNTFSSINGILSGRLIPLSPDIVNTNTHKDLAKTIFDQMNDIISLLSSAWNIHLNVNQNVTINNSVIFFFLEKLILSAVSDRFNQSHLHLPGNVNRSVLFRKMLQPLAFFTDVSLHTEFSRSFSLSILDQNGTDLRIETSPMNPIELVIPRDPNVVIPLMFIQRVTEKNTSFNYHFVNLTANHAIHFELHPTHFNLSYLFLHRFDGAPQLSISDGSPKLFCPSDLNKDGNYVHFLDNNETANHQSIVYAIRQLTSDEMDEFCSEEKLHRNLLLIINRTVNLAFNYSMRIYQSGCFYLDSNNSWQTDGLLVGPRTNHYQTHCLSTHF